MFASILWLPHPGLYRLRSHFFSGSADLQGVGVDAEALDVLGYQRIFRNDAGRKTAITEPMGTPSGC